MKKVLMWGTGMVAQMLIEKCDILLRNNVKAFVDNKLEKKTFYGISVITPDKIEEYDFDGIIIATEYYSEIVLQINSMKLDLNFCILTPQDIYKQMIYDRYCKSTEKDIQNILKYLINHDLQMFPYNFVDEYDNQSVSVYFDDKCNMYYVYHNDKKLYFAKYLNNSKKVESYYKSILIEQDKRSPHLYQKGTICVNKGDVIVDVGAAEGIFTLENIDAIAKAYLIEANEQWIEALHRTFEPYKDKIDIKHIFLSSATKGRLAALDDIIDEEVDFIKMDIEGYEWEALIGAEKTIKKSQKLRCSICTYHRIFDGELIKQKLESYGLRSEYSKGYVWFNPLQNGYMNSSPTYLVKCLVRGKKLIN